MNIGLFLLCIIFSYLLSYIFSCFNIIAFNSAILILHRFMGPEWIYHYSYVFLMYFYEVLFFMVTHYYLTSVVVILICLRSLIICIMRLFSTNSSQSQLDYIREDVVDLSQKVDDLESKIDDVLATLERIEKHLR